MAGILARYVAERCLGGGPITSPSRAASTTSWSPPQLVDPRMRSICAKSRSISRKLPPVMLHRPRHRLGVGRVVGGEHQPQLLPLAGQHEAQLLVARGDGTRGRSPPASRTGRSAPAASRSPASRSAPTPARAGRPIVEVAECSRAGILRRSASSTSSSSRPWLRAGRRYRVGRPAADVLDQPSSKAEAQPASGRSASRRGVVVTAGV